MMAFFKSINHASLWYKDDPFILATQATKVFYLLDTKYGDNWRVVQKFSHRHLWSVAENDIDDLPNVLLLSYQDDECEDMEVQHDESPLQDEQPFNTFLEADYATVVDATVVDDLRGQRETEVQENEESDGEDDTECQYMSDNDNPKPSAEDDDDDSDYE